MKVCMVQDHAERTRGGRELLVGMVKESGAGTRGKVRQAAVGEETTCESDRKQHACLHPYGEQAEVRD